VDWGTISSLATAFGTLVLAVATFSSIRSANRSARTAERALSFNIRPLLFQSRLSDGVQKVTWVDRRVHRLDGGHGIAEVADDVIYMAVSLRNAGAGMAVIQSWSPMADLASMPASHAPLETFRPQTRDLYIAPSDTGFWQGAIRDRADAVYAPMAAAITAQQSFLIEVQYCNAEGGQRTISRFLFFPIAEAEKGWLCSVGRHFSLDHDLPR